MQSCLKRSRHLLQFCVALTLTDVSVPGHIACCPTVLPVSTCWQCRVVFCDSRTLGHGATLLRRIYCVPLVLGTVKAIQHKMQDWGVERIEGSRSVLWLLGLGLGLAAGKIHTMAHIDPNVFVHVWFSAPTANPGPVRPQGAADWTRGWGQAAQAVLV